MTTSQARQIESTLPKCPTGIQGLDEITNGGLPKGRPTLVCGGAGSGKTLLAMEFLVCGAQQYKEPGVFACFEESAQELMDNVISLGWDLKDLIDKKRLVIDHIRIEPSEIQETGEYDLEGLFVRLGHAIESLKAKRVALIHWRRSLVGLPASSSCGRNCAGCFIGSRTKGSQRSLPVSPERAC